MTITFEQALTALEKYSPRWVEYIRQVGLENAMVSGDDEHQKPLDITWPDRCIVAEFHGFTKDYHCDRCDIFSFTLIHTKLQPFADAVERFLNHITCSHPEQVK